jgi:hypothetical protein
MPKGVYIRSGRRAKSSAPTKCAICNHAERHRIEMLSVAGASLDKLAEQFGVSRDSIWRHMGRHVTDEAKAAYLLGPGKVHQLIEKAAIENASVLDYYALVRSALVRQLTHASSNNDGTACASIARALRELGRASGQITAMATTQINVTNNHLSVVNSQPFAELQAGLLRLCAKHPDARADVIDLFPHARSEIRPAARAGRFNGYSCDARGERPCRLIPMALRCSPSWRRRLKTIGSPTRGPNKSHLPAIGLCGSF